jgi:hypothetical protein
MKKPLNGAFLFIGDREDLIRIPGSTKLPGAILHARSAAPKGRRAGRPKYKIAWSNFARTQCSAEVQICLEQICIVADELINKRLAIDYCRILALYFGLCPVINLPRSYRLRYFGQLIGCK